MKKTIPGKLKSKTTLFWKVILIVLGIISLSSGLIRSPGFWSAYLLDIEGPAWGYVLLGARYKAGDSGFLTFRFSPEVALAVTIIICYLIKVAQSLEIYNPHFDPYDFLAYITGILPVYPVDKLLKPIAE